MNRDLTLTPSTRHGLSYWLDLWSARELLGYLVWRDITVRYKQASLGLFWVLLRPVMSTLVFSLVFGKIANLPAGDVAYPLLVLSGMAPWVYFSSTTTECSNSLISNASLITKVYFPRLAIPVATVFTNMVDFAITFFLLLIVLVYYGHSLSWTILFLPALLLVLILLSIGIGLWTSSLNVKYRDLQFILPFALTLGLYISPIGYSSSLVPETWRWLYNLNPLVGIIDCFRWIVFGSRHDFQWWTLGYTFVVAVVLVISGTYVFRAVEREIVDIL